MNAQNYLQVGQKVNNSGYEFSVISFLDYAPSMVEIQGASGICVVDFRDLKLIGSDNFIGR